ncbi:magnesium transporter [Limtongia smithiae]|uniref:magnesium transporter n=1 Tax=Limtongia smithiae TaxID=1125753 RepID=UPI0034D015BB
MTAVSRLLTVFSLVLLAHAGFSAYEFSHYVKHLAIKIDAPLPIDIIAETIVGAILFALAQVIAAPKLQPVLYSKWAKALERDRKGPYTFLEARPNYLNIHELRAKYAAANLPQE